MFLNFLYDSRTAYLLCRQRFITSYLLMPHSMNKFQNLEFKGNTVKVVTCTISNTVWSGALTVALCVHFKISLSFV